MMLYNINSEFPQQIICRYKLSTITNYQPPLKYARATVDLAVDLEIISTTGIISTARIISTAEIISTATKRCSSGNEI